MQIGPAKYMVLLNGFAEWMNEWANKFTQKKKPKNLSHHFWWSIFPMQNYVNSKWIYGKISNFYFLQFTKMRAVLDQFFYYVYGSVFGLRNTCIYYETNTASWFAEINLKQSFKCPKLIWVSDDFLFSYFFTIFAFFCLIWISNQLP